MKTRIVKSINGIFAELSGWLLCAMMVLLIVDFISRLLYKPVRGVGETAVFVLVAVVYLGIPHCEEVKGHVRVNALITRLPPRLRHVVNLFDYFIALLTVLMVVYAVVQDALYSYLRDESVAGPTPLLIYPVKIVIVIGCVFYWLQLLHNTIEEVKEFKTEI
jgi:TRAP-type C4-dicarboxylate transport system permease small subunit